VILAVAAATLAGAGMRGAAAGTPRFAVFDLQRDLAKASHDLYGDVKAVEKRDVLAARARDATLVRCVDECRFGSGWFAFAKPSTLAAGDLVRGSVRSAPVKHDGWGVTVRLTAAGAARWSALSRHATLQLHRRGVPDVYVFVVDGVAVYTPLAVDVRSSGATLSLVGLSRSDARRLAKLFGGV
jgi:hypothetical protein